MSTRKTKTKSITFSARQEKALISAIRKALILSDAHQNNREFNALCGVYLQLIKIEKNGEKS